jgi:hypothetical protein
MASSAAASEPAVPAEPEAEAEEESDNLLLYISIGIGNLLVLVLGYVAYRLIAGKGDKDELAEIEKTLAVSSGNLKKDTGGKTAIDVSGDDQMAHIPMGDTSGSEMSMSDDLMADNLFPLDNMDEPTSDKK